MWRRIVFLSSFIFFGIFQANAQQTDTFWVEDFKNGFGDWYSDNGIWDVGIPTTGPDSAISDSQVAATILDGKYPYGPDSKLISPIIDLPNISENEELLLRYQQYFNWSSADRGTVEMRFYNNDANEWSDWIPLNSYSSYISDWHYARIDISEYAGQRVRLGFQHTDQTEDPDGTVHHYESWGWYIDDVEIIKQSIPHFQEKQDFEFDLNGWFSDRGIWQVGMPSAGPDSAYSGGRVFGTVLDGNYLYGPDSRLISPIVNLPLVADDEEIILRFQQYFHYASADRGYLQIQSYDVSIDEWSDWVTLDSFRSHVVSWHHAKMDLSEYSGKMIRIGFYHVDRTEDPDGIVYHYEGLGWFIDDVEVFKQTNPYYTQLQDFEGEINGWYSEDGIWQKGVPSTGPDSAFSGKNLFATNLDGNYLYGPDSRLISPRINLPDVSGGKEVVLRFQQFFNYASSDQADVQIQIYNIQSDSWSEWIVLDTFKSYVTDWHHARIDLTQYAGNIVRIGFHHIDRTEDPDGIVHHYESLGWYIDDFVITCSGNAGPVMDLPVVELTPDSLTKTLNLWEHTNDPDTPDSLLSYTFNSPDSFLSWSFDKHLGELEITSSSFDTTGGRVFVSVADECFASSYDTIFVDRVVGLNGGASYFQPLQFNLSQNYPNPFNPSTEIPFTLPRSSKVNLTIFNALGQKVATLIDGNRPPGEHTARFDASGLASGVYYYRIKTKGFVQTRKMLLLR